jgi:hypothetical protein
LIKGRSFDHRENNVSIFYTVPEYNKYINVEYNYILKVFKINGILKEVVSFKNLPAGNYVFKVKAKYIKFKS